MSTAATPFSLAAYIRISENETVARPAPDETSARRIWANRVVASSST